jgi:UDP-N-acetylmuramoyl-tripeptide--D-alanyl-D-alanine ligase
MIEKDSNKIILDAYNANPSSMKAAIENFARLNGEHKVLMLGGMMELGKESMAEHESVIKLIQSYPVWKSVVLVGGDFQLIKNPFINFKNSSEAKEWYREQHFFGAQILIKGSRSIQMEKVIEN